MASSHQPRVVQVLSKEVIHRIAAGEVVDRPASVLKELIENSIDAQATELKITLIEGGLKAIIVEDNGIGMSERDLSLCLQRHATSKIQNVEDLDKLFSLGFRGEALAAISSVAEVEIHTFRDLSGGWTLKARGGLETYLGPGTQSQGTRLEVKDLFYNVPARKKFIKSTSAETRACIDVLEHLALCFPQVAFSWFSLKESTGEILEDMQLPAQSLEERAKAAIGITQDPYFLHVQEGLPEGVLSLDLVFWGPPHFFNTQKHVSLCVNGRAVFDKRLGYSLREAYYGVIPVGVFPAVHVSMQVNPEIIDANIHPQKKELRWPKGFSLAGLIYRFIRPHFDLLKSRMPESSNTYAQQQTEIVTELAFDSQVASETNQATNALEVQDFLFRSSVPLNSIETPLISLPANPSNSAASEHFVLSSHDQKSLGFFSSKRVVGEVGARWLILESSSGMLVVDQHAAHERVNFEKFLTMPNLIRSVPLLTPIKHVLQASSSSAKNKELVMDTLETFGFEFNRDDTVSASELEIIAVPEADRKLKWSDWITDIVESVERDQETLGLLDKIKTHVAASLSCHGSVRFGQRLDKEQIQSLLQQMDAVQWGRYCPHGRPVFFELSHDELEKRFDRS